MVKLLPCPICGFENLKPRTRSKFNCKGDCEKPLELSEDLSYLQDYTARIEADKVRIDQFWRTKAADKAKKEGIDFDTAYKMVIEGRDKNNLKMRKPVTVKVSFPPIEDATPAPKPQPYTNNTKPVVAMSTTSEDDTDAPF